ncbi:PAS domain S-box protein [Rhodospirillaceae bacterium SYSU D60014]|uniref:PAS domain S-box protein n=1 Tax=Virgifigura deserti TaxID=2268457 RepID=UPI0013C461B9
MGVTAQIDTDGVGLLGPDLLPALLDTIDALVIVTDRAGRILRFNRACESASGYAGKDVIGKVMWQVLVPPDEIGIVETAFNRLSAETRKTTYRSHWVARSGERRLIRWTNAVLAEEGAGRSAFCVATGIDITDSTRAEKTGGGMMQTAEAVCDQILGFVGLLDAGGAVVKVNQAALALGGVTMAEVSGRPIWAVPWRIASAEGRKRLRRAVAVAAAGEPVRDEIDILAADHRPVTIDFSLKPIREESGPGDSQVSMLIFEGLDVTDRKQAYAALHESEIRLRGIVDTAPDGIIRIDERGTILSFNPAAEDLFGYAADEIIGRNVKRLLPASEGERFIHYIERYVERGLKRSKIGSHDVLGRHKDGTTFAMELSVSEVRFGDRRTFTGFVRDISRRKAAEAKLQQQQAEIAHVMRLNTMVAMASAIGHELNQPLTAIMSYTQACQRMLMSSDDIPADLRHAMSMIVAQTQRAGDIIRHVKDFTRKGESLRREQDINRIVLTAIDLQAVEARRHRVTIRSDFDTKLPAVMVDRIQIEQVVLNLVRNSVQAIVDAATGEREVRVSTSLNSENAVEVAVDDTGPGIPATVARRLFEPFVTSKMNGMGVGLTICRSIINAHGGKLWAASKPGGGAVFRFTLPSAEEGARP